MGFGGITALGCTIGQGLSGLSTLAIGLVHRDGRHRRRFGGDAALIAWREERAA